MVSCSSSRTHTLANRYTRRRDNGGKKTRFLLFAFRYYVRARVYRCILSFLSAPPHHPGTHDADRSGSLGTNIVIYTSGKPGGANNGMNVSSPRGGKCKNVSFYPRRVESKFGRVVFFAKKKSMGTCGKSHYYGGWEKKQKQPNKETNAWWTYPISYIASASPRVP